MQFVLNYPEFMVAALLGVLLAARSLFDGTSRVGNALADAAKSVVYLLPERYLATLQRNQTWSGWRGAHAVELLCALKVYPALLLGFALGIFHPVAGIVAAVWAFFIADLVVYVRRTKRQREILSSLPQALDLMVLCVDAGLGLDAALQRVASDQSVLTEALSDELAMLNRDVLFGMDRSRAYEDLYVRTGVEELRTFGSALNQSAKLGLSIAQVIRAQSDFVRLKQHQRAEEKASKVAIWMVFPLWFCIMPALMIILLAPSLLVFFKSVSHFPPEWFM
jgi:pilus assembly protein TadC